MKTSEQFLNNRMRIVAEVAAKHGVEVADIMGQSVARHIGHARLEAYYRLRVEADTKPYAYLKIAAFFGRDHSTIITGVEKVAARLRAGGEWEPKEPYQTFDRPHSIARRTAPVRKMPLPHEVKRNRKLSSKQEAARLTDEEKKLREQLRIEKSKRSNVTRAFVALKERLKEEKKVADLYRKMQKKREAEYRAEVKNASAINAYWFERGKNANAVVVEVEPVSFIIRTKLKDIEIAA